MATKKINKKNLYIALGAFVLLLAYVIIFGTEQTSNEKKKKKKLFNYVIADVSKFEIQRPDSVITVEREGNNWFITKPRQLPASSSDVESYLIDVKDLSIERELGKDIADLSPYGLDNPKYVLKIWLGTGKDAKLLTLKIGNQNPDKSGFYAKLENRPSLFLLETLAETTIDKQLFYFRNKDIFKVDVNNINEIIVKNDKYEYKLEKVDGNWQMKSPVVSSNIKEADSTKILTTISDLKVKSYYDGKNKVSLVDAAVLNPSVKIVLIDNNKKEYVLNIGTEVKNKSEYYGRRDDEDLIFGVDKYTIDNLQKDLLNLKKNIEEEKKKKEEAARKKAEEAAKKNKK